jgi:uncharacterized protein YbjT (DUF2867 family)
MANDGQGSVGQAGPDILITGATGNVGGQLVRHLVEQGAGNRVAAAARDLEDGESSAVFGEAVAARKLDFDDPGGHEKALRGIRSLFLMRPPAIADVRKRIFPFIDAALACGVEQIVFLSLYGAGKNPWVPHRKIEDYLLKKSVDRVFLRPSFFMENLTGIHAEEIRREGRIMVPAGRGRTNLISGKDIAEAAAHYLLNPAGGADGHGAPDLRIAELTGPAAHDYFEIADILTRVTGREIAYAKPGIWRFLVYHRRKGTPWGFALVMAGLYTLTRLGRADVYSPDLVRLLGREGESFATFAWRNRDVWLDR